MSNLFDPKDINTQIEESARLKSQAEPSIYTEPAHLAEKPNKLAKCIIEHLACGDMHINFVTSGDLSLHTLIEKIVLAHPDPSELWISTWAVKESAARKLIHLKSAGKINCINAVFDYRIRSVDAKTYFLLHPYLNKCALTKNHAKVVVINFGRYVFTIVTSANLSNNPRVEAGFVSASQTTAQFHMDWMSRVLSGQKVV
jgi:hypothetical protein